MEIFSGGVRYRNFVDKFFGYGRVWITLYSLPKERSGPASQLDCMSAHEAHPFPLDIEGIQSHEYAWVRNPHAWVEESFAFESSIPHQVESSHLRAHLGISLTKKHVQVCLALIGAILFGISGRIFFLQVVRGTAYRALADSNRLRTVPIPAERGLILDRHGTPLTKNIPNFSLAIVPQNLPHDPTKKADVIRRLAALTHRSETDIAGVIQEYGAYSYESITIQDNLDYNTALSIQIAGADLPGIEIERGSKRLYVTNEPGTNTVSSSTLSLSHILGYEGKLSRSELDSLYGDGYLPTDSIGKSGVEKTFESYLRGTYGKEQIEVDALGREQSVLGQTAPVPGRHIQLAIDLGMQHALEQILAKTLAANRKTRGVAVVMDPRNGEVLAMVSLPTFNNNDFAGGISPEAYGQYKNNPDQPLFNRAVGGTYPSGSVIKPAIAAAALHEGVITARTTVLSTGGLQVGPWFFPDWQAGGHGITDVRKSLAWSVNTFYYYIGGGYKDFVGLGVERIVNYLRMFGFASPLGVDLPGEASGFLPSKEWKQTVKKEAWYVGDTYNLSIGEGDLLVTPLQIAAMTAAVANGGTLYRPHVVRAIVDPVTNQATSLPVQAIRQNITDAAAITTVQLGMRDCVIYGSCRRLGDLPFAVAGKTGTAQWRSDKANHGWFTSFAPFDHPQVVVTVLVEEGGEGSSIAVPVADEFYHYWWTHKNN